MEKKIKKINKGSNILNSIASGATVLLYAMLMGAVGYILSYSGPIGLVPVEDPGVKPVEDVCRQKAKVSDICSAVGYEFDSAGGKCVVVNGAGCVDKLPFANLEECQDACEGLADAARAVVGEDLLITLDANVSTGYSWEADFDEHYLMLQSKEFVADRNGPKLGASGKEVFTFTPIRAGRTTVKMGYSRPWEDGAVERKDFDYRISANKDVSLMTGQTEYKKGEAVGIRMNNISNSQIWFMEGVSNCNTRPYRIMKLNEGKWDEVSGYPTICVGPIEGQVPFYTKVRSEFPVPLEWDQKLWDYPRQTYDADAGIYMIVMKYSRSGDGSGQRDIYSNEFAIKENTPEVMTPDYVISHSDELKGKTISVEGKAAAGSSRICTKMACGISNPCCNTCSGDLFLKGEGESIVLSSKAVNTPMYCSGNDCGLDKCYPLEIDKYFKTEGVWNGNELEMISWEEAGGNTVIDPKCGQKVSGNGACEAYREGFEFDRDSGECIKRGASGCSFNVPFETLRDCETACVDKTDKTDFYSCAQDSDCISVKLGPCGCTSGGANTAINKKYRNIWQKGIYDDMMCPAVMSDDPSCFKEPRCVENSCVMQ